jgi:aquaporin Z
MFGRNKIAMIVAEFLGTAVLTMIVLTMAYSPNGGYPSFFIAVAVGVVLVAMTLALGRVSGAHLNPAITIGLWSARLVKTLPAVVYVAAQLLGGVSAYALFNYFTKGNFPPLGKFDSHILVAEAVGAFVFAFGWAAAVYQKLDAAKAAATVGVSLFLGVMVASIGSAGFVNPALALGAKSWVWGTYVLGPVLGAVIGFNLYALLFAPKEALLHEGAEIVGDTDTNVDKPRKVKAGKRRK